MQKLTGGAFIRWSGLSAFIILGLILTSTTVVVAQSHEMKNMPGMKMGNSKSKSRKKAAPKKRRVARKRRPADKLPAKKQEMPGMNMRKASPAKIPETPTVQPSPGQMQMNMPATNPSASPQKMEMNMPGMQMPTVSPDPQVSPQQKMDMNMPVPAASPGAAPQKMDMNMPMPQPNASPGTSMNANSMANMPGMGPMNLGPLVVMSGKDMGVRVGDSDLNVLSCGQMGTGTSWTPPSSPMYSYDKITGKWLFMFHFNAFVGVNSQGGPRGVTKLESQNWIMPMAFRKLGPGTLQLRGMFSFEPFTFPRGGSPLLFQTGETYKDQPIIDRQHPHDLWMELSATYTLPLGERATWFTYFGYPGEPALGPTAFMHRPSASENPSAALSHHLQDSTHISFGVLTTGFTYRWFKLEGSIFNGREPDENRYDFEAHPWDSRSARLSFTPNQNWSAQVSYGFLRRPEAAEPNTDIRRTTASVQYNKSFDHGNWAAALIWGRNHQSGGGERANLNGYTAESTVNFMEKNYFYTRLELVDKNEMLRPADRARLGIKVAHPSFRIGAYTFGGARDIWNTKKLSTAIGSDVTFYSMPSVLNPIYGKRPVSWKLFLRIRPAKMDMSSH
jgi:hypothetical protein